MTTKNKVKEVQSDHLSDDEFAPENVKVRITTFIDADVVAQLRAYAKTNRTKYQTALNSILRSFFEGSPKGGSLMSFDQRVRRIVREEIKKKK